MRFNSKKEPGGVGAQPPSSYILLSSCASLNNKLSYIPEMQQIFMILFTSARNDVFFQIRFLNIYISLKKGGPTLINLDS